jgi:O-6-methylguanine DNA methyltransferase
MPTLEISAGPLSVTATFDTENRLQSVELPKSVPVGLDTAHLSQILRALGKYELAFPKSGPFVQKVWARLTKIPWGQALTYGELAADLGNPRASRAIGQACGKNRLLLIVPCHRVVGEVGLGGFAYGIEWKATLLALETEAA